MEAGRFGERDGEQRVMAPPVGRRSAVRATRPKTSKSFLRGKSLKGKCRLSLSAMGSGGWHDQKKHLTRAGLLMESRRDRKGALMHRRSFLTTTLALPTSLRAANPNFSL